MLRIWIAGPSGSGKTTLANKLGSKLNIPVYHRDKITWMGKWEQRSEDEQIELSKEISAQEKWIFEGNRFNSAIMDNRLERCDTIIYLNLNRFLCLYRSFMRYLKHRGTIRPDMPDECVEQYDFVLARYILFDYPRKENERNGIFADARKLGKSVIILNGRKAVKRFYDKHGLK